MSGLRYRGRGGATLSATTGGPGRGQAVQDLIHRCLYDRGGIGGHAVVVDATARRLHRRLGEFGSELRLRYAGIGEDVDQRGGQDGVPVEDAPHVCGGQRLESQCHDGGVARVAHHFRVRVHISVYLCGQVGAGVPEYVADAFGGAGEFVLDDRGDELRPGFEVLVYAWAGQPRSPGEPRQGQRFRSPLGNQVAGRFEQRGELS